MCCQPWIEYVSAHRQRNSQVPLFYMGYLRDTTSRSVDCPLCRLVVHLIVLSHGCPDTHYLSNHIVTLKWVRADTEGRRLGHIDVRLIKGLPLYRGFLDAMEAAIPRLDFRLELVPCDAVGSEAQSGAEDDDQGLRRGYRPIPAQVDVQLLLGWLEQCEANHGPPCEDLNLPTTEGPRNLQLLDVQALRVVAAPKDPSYFALSYVWGGIAPPEPVRFPPGQSDIRGFGSVWDRVPATIRDAVTLVKLLRGRYIWVDSMCIDQSAGAEKLEQIMQMDKIYAHARLTIVAGGGRDSDAGLAGVRPGTRLPVQKATLGRYTLISSLPDEGTLRTGVQAIQAFEGSVWNQRGWTYQERVLSRKCLFFTDYQVYFICRSATLREDYDTDAAVGPTRIEPDGSNTPLSALVCTPRNRPGRLLTLMPFNDFLSEFSRRKFTHQSDVLKASFAALRILAHRMETTVTWGLPESLFHRAMFWSLEARQKATGGSRRKGFPSWSWASWTGEVTLMSHAIGMRSCVVWYQLRTDRSLRQIQSVRMRKFSPDCDNNKADKESWVATDYNPPTASHFPPGYRTDDSTEGHDTGLLVGWAVVQPVRLSASSHSPNGRHWSTALCDVISARQGKARSST